MNWLILVWMIVYFVFPIAWILLAIRLKADLINAVANSMLFGIIVILPYLVVGYSRKLPMNIGEADVTIVIHLVLTLLACLTIVIWGITLGYLAMRQGVSPLRAVFLLISPLAGLTTIIVALAEPNWFVDRNAYVNRELISWIWPDTIDAPITYFRIGLAATFLLVPFVRWSKKDQDIDN